MKDWELEPNILKFEYRSYKCEIKRHEWGYLNAYVFIPKNHILYGIDELDLNEILKPSSEITYSQEYDGFWKIGLSFSSIRDFVPYEPEGDKPEFMKRLEEFFGFEAVGPEHYKNIEHAIEQLRLLIDKIGTLN